MTMQKKRTANFRDDETRLLIQLWGSPTIQTQMNTCHRKAPIMSQLASLMAQYGFYRTPEEITTRIRNLKCIYHKIKKSFRSNVSTVDPDWHHFKAMDAILGCDDSSVPLNNNMNNFSGTVIKKEVGVLDDVAESLYSNDSQSLMYENDGDTASNFTASSPMQGLTITSSTATVAGPSSTTRPNPTGIYKFNYTYNTENEVSSRNSPVRQNAQDATTRLRPPNTKINQYGYNEDCNNISTPKKSHSKSQDNTGITDILRQLVDVEREHLELERQRLEFDRLVGSHLMALVPMVGNILQNHAMSQHQNTPSHTDSDETIQPAPGPSARQKDRPGKTQQVTDSSDEIGSSILQSFTEFQSLQRDQKHNSIVPLPSTLSKQTTVQSESKNQNALIINDDESSVDSSEDCSNLFPSSKKISLPSVDMFMHESTNQSAVACNQQESMTSKQDFHNTDGTHVTQTKYSDHYQD